MSEGKHTPAPWVLDANDNTRVRHRDPKTGMTVAVVSLAKSLERAEADARLIAAAPDLLEALRLYDVCDAMPSDRGGKDGPRGRAYQAFVSAKKAALAKASPARLDAAIQQIEAANG